MASAPAKNTPSGGGSQPQWQMPSPPALVLWCNAPGGEQAYAVVTKYNRNSVSLAVFAPDSRALVPKDAVRHVNDPWNKTNGINGESGVWDFTSEHKEFLAVKRTLAEMVLAEAATK